MHFLFNWLQKNKTTKNVYEYILTNVRAKKYLLELLIYIVLN